MKRLTLFRHAKSSWSESDLPDSERPLANRGERDAPLMGMRLKARKSRPSLILSSPAVRAKETARIVARTLGYPDEFLQIDRSLYLADPATILEVVSAQDERFADVLIVGHNPGLTELVNLLLPDLALANLPTAGVVALESDTHDWNGLLKSSRRLLYFDYPKNTEPVFIEHCSD